MTLPPPLALAVSIYLTVLRVFAGTTMAIIVVVMIAQVWVRYVAGGSLIWAEELCRYLLIWQTFLVIGLAYSKGEFIAIDFLPAALSDRGKRILKLVSAVPIVAFLVVIAIYGADYASRFSQQTIPALDFIWGALFGDRLGLSIKYVYISVSVGAVLMILHVCADVVVSFDPAVGAAVQDGIDDEGDTVGTGGRQG